MTLPTPALGFALVLVSIGLGVVGCDSDPEPACMSAVALGAEFDSVRVERFLDEYNSWTFGVSRRQRIATLDSRVSRAALPVGDKAAAFCRVAARAEATWGPQELRLERLLVSVSPDELSLFKFGLEYDLDYKDMEEYVFHDVDDVEVRARMLRHLGLAPFAGRKVLTDVDDSMYANLVDDRYPKKTIYPGVLDFYEALAQEPWDHDGIVLTTLSARPNPIAGLLEESSLEALFEHTGRRVRASGLSGEVVSSAVGTAQTLLRDPLDEFSYDVPDGEERAIGEAKFANFLNFAAVYPEYRFVFIGDSGQADALTAELMIATGDSANPRVTAAFIHDLRPTSGTARGASPSFLGIDPALIVGPDSVRAPGIIVFRNYIDAAVQAYQNTDELDVLITADELARVTVGALGEFLKVPFEDGSSVLRQQYREDATTALALLDGEHVLADSIRTLRQVF